jgi:hypothetical protein
LNEPTKTPVEPVETRFGGRFRSRLRRKSIGYSTSVFPRSKLSGG